MVAQRSRDEYKVECQFEAVGVQQTRWIKCEDEKMLADFRVKLVSNLAIDHADELVYTTHTRVNVQMTQECWPDVEFLLLSKRILASLSGVNLLKRTPVGRTFGLLFFYHTCDRLVLASFVRQEMSGALAALKTHTLFLFVRDL